MDEVALMVYYEHQKLFGVDMLKNSKKLFKKSNLLYFPDYVAPQDPGRSLSSVKWKRGKM